MMSELPELPGVAGELVRAIGPVAAVALIEAHGGTRVYVPPPPYLTKRRDHALVKLLGLNAALALSRWRLGMKEGRVYGKEPGVHFMVPLCREVQRLMVVRLYREGWSAGRLAREFHRTEDWVYRIVREAEAQRGRARNLDIFGDGAA